MYHKTIDELEKYSDNIEFERFCCEILSRLGYRGIEPQGVGKKDGGKDALLNTSKAKVVFHFSLRKDWDKKIYEDLEKVKDKDYSKFVFVSNHFIPPMRRDKLKKEIEQKYNLDSDIYDQERLRNELDSHSLDLRERYFNIKSDDKKLSQVDLIVNKLVNSKLSEHYIISTPKILFISIPIDIKSNKYTLFNDNFEFIADKLSLTNILSQAFIPKSFITKVFSEGLELYEKHNIGISVPIGLKTYSMKGFKDAINICRVYHKGVIYYQLDIEEVELNKKFLHNLLKSLFKVTKDVNNLFNVRKGIFRFSINFVNADDSLYNKNNGGYKGEKALFEEDFELNIKEIDSKIEGILTKLTNKIDAFYNQPM
ncbi:MAG: hypothetical protein KKE93_00640 [Nanoarchaeota archaeon]|nr:hypothetical protein [Nanoarchaeota archaeon]